MSEDPHTRGEWCAEFRRLDSWTSRARCSRNSIECPTILIDINVSFTALPPCQDGIAVLIDFENWKHYLHKFIVRNNGSNRVIDGFANNILEKESICIGKLQLKARLPTHVEFAANCTGRQWRSLHQDLKLTFGAHHFLWQRRSLVKCSIRNEMCKLGGLASPRALHPNGFTCCMTE
ncbi:hypothetical protein BDZ97DRAFT_79002 [Flammula alnicola]|nr:hypothetical protein BDZ97DRAFT_79002 [Flammula alnicola]